MDGYFRDIFGYCHSKTYVDVGRQEWIRYANALYTRLRTSVTDCPNHILTLVALYYTSIRYSRHVFGIADLCPLSHGLAEPVLTRHITTLFGDCFETIPEPTIVHGRHVYNGVQVYVKYAQIPHAYTEACMYQLVPTHTNLPVYHGMFVKDDDRVGFVMEDLPVDFTTAFPRRQVGCSYFIRYQLFQLITAVRALHHAGIAHRDIKTPNIRFRSDGTLVLYDFDLSSHHTNCRRSQLPVCTSTTRAPEIYECMIDQNALPYDSYKVDIWSIGVILSHMMYGRQWLVIKHDLEEGDPSGPEYYREIVQYQMDRVSHIPSLPPSTNRNLLASCLTIDPGIRPTIDHLFYNPVFDMFR
jgi:serine/threonine protein kinase